MSLTTFPYPMSGIRRVPRTYKKLDSSYNSSSEQSCLWCSQIELCDVNGYLQERTAVDPELFREYFHSSCEYQSSFHGYDSFPTSTCGFCRHLNIEHLVDCILASHQHSNGRNSFKVIFTDWYCRIDAATDCQLCQFIAQFISASEGISEIGLQLGTIEGKHWCEILGTEESTILNITHESCKQLDLKVDWDLVKSWPLEDSQEEKDQRFKAMFKSLLEMISSGNLAKMGREVMPGVNIIDMRSPSEWRRHCSQGPHRAPEASTQPSQEEKKMPPRHFRVIDVEENCIVAPCGPVDYVALSYVWGPTPSDELYAKRANIDQLEKSQGLVKSELPATISDAMTACQKLGKRYLWVDRFCIVQDAYDSKLEQINCMDSIYKSAAFTIVALSSDNSRTGLVGVSQARQKRLAMLKWQHSFLIHPFPPLKQLVENSLWNTRGWTFQESLCSRNLLYFTDHGVYLSIRDDVMSERLSAHIRGSDGILFSFPESVETYCKRNLSNPNDILPAFTGVLNLQYQDDHYFGAPTWGNDISPSMAFSGWIQWNPVKWTCPPRNSEDNHVFPSWSWISAIGGVKFNKAYGSTAGLEAGSPLALWAIPASPKGGELRLKWVCERSAVHRLKHITTESAVLQTEDDQDEAVDKNSSDGPSPTLLRVFEDEDKKRAHSNVGSALVFTQFAFLGLEELQYHFPDGRCTFRIQSSDKRRIGGIWLSTSAADIVRRQTNEFEDAQFEFLALDLVNHAYTVERITSGIGPVFGPCSLEAAVVSAQLCECVHSRPAMNVMLIDRCKDTGVARRLGMGQVFMGEWRHQEPKLLSAVLV